MPKFINQKSIFILQYRILQQISQIFEILGLYWLAFTALAMDKTFTQRNFYQARFKLCQCISQ